jgi:acyl-CoA thioesterase-1
MKRIFLLTFFLSVAYVFPAYSSTQIIMFGDSLVAGYNLAATDALPSQLEAAFIKKGLDVKVVNAGISGDTTFGGIERVNSILEQKPNVVIIVLGGNDMLRGIDPEKTYQNLEQIITTLQKNNIKVMLCEMKSSANYGLQFKSKFDAIYPKLSKKYSLPLIPFFMEKILYDPTKLLSDGIHPNALGVTKIVQNILPIIEKEVK